MDWGHRMMTTQTSRTSLRDERVSMCLERLVRACLMNPRARFRYSERMFTVLVEESSGCLLVLGIIDVDSPDATMIIANTVEKVRV